LWGIGAPKTRKRRSKNDIQEERRQIMDEIVSTYGRKFLRHLEDDEEGFVQKMYKIFEGRLLEHQRLRKQLKARHNRVEEIKESSSLKNPHFPQQKKDI